MTLGESLSLPAPSLCPGDLLMCCDMLGYVLGAGNASVCRKHCVLEGCWQLKLPPARFQQAWKQIMGVSVHTIIKGYANVKQ